MQEQPTQHYFQASGARICYFEWGSKGDPGVLLLHATGFHARCWDQMIAALPQRFHVIAVDMRGHGRSEKVAPYVWRSFATDVRELIVALSCIHRGKAGLKRLSGELDGEPERFTPWFKMEWERLRREFPIALKVPE